jgi:hypothetical protein
VPRQRELPSRFFTLIATTGRSPRLDALLLFIGGMFPGSFYLESPGRPAHDAAYRTRLLAALDEELAAQVTDDYLRGARSIAVDYLKTLGRLADG